MQVPELTDDAVVELAREGGVAFIPKLSGQRTIALSSLNEAQRQRHVQFGEHADAFIDARRHRNGGNNDGERNQRRFRRHRIRNIKQHAQPVVELHHANPERGRNTEDGADHRRDIDAVANRAVNLFTENRVQRGANSEGQIITIAKVSQRHAHQGVH